MCALFASIVAPYKRFVGCFVAKFFAKILRFHGACRLLRRKPLNFALDECGICYTFAFHSRLCLVRISFPSKLILCSFCKIGPLFDAHCVLLEQFLLAVYIISCASAYATSIMLGWNMNIWTKYMKKKTRCIHSNWQLIPFPMANIHQMDVHGYGCDVICWPNHTQNTTAILLAFSANKRKTKNCSTTFRSVDFQSERQVATADVLHQLTEI